MKTLIIGGVFLLAGLSLAGNAAAECESGPVGLFDYDYANVCVLESYSYSYPPYYEYSNNNVLQAYFYGYNANPYEYTNAGADLGQYAGSSCWGCGGNPDTYGGTYGDLYLYRYADGDYAYAGAYFGQYNGDGNGYDYAGSYAGVYYGAGGEYADLYFDQFSYNGDCNEQLAMYDSGSGYSEIIPYGPCTLEIPQLPALPAL